MDSWVIYGVNPVLAAMEAEQPLEAIYLAVGLNNKTRGLIESQARQLGIKVLKTDRRELDRMAQGGTHQGIVALAGKPRSLSLEDLASVDIVGRKVILCLDGIQDPRNLGAIARSAAAFGAVGMVLPAQRAAKITPAAIKASAGALSFLPVVQVTNLARALDSLKQMGYWVAGAVVLDGQPPALIDPGEKVALVLGSEGEGMREKIEERLDYRVMIPTKQQMVSLNVSVAAAILLHAWLA